ncbi:hypothetical protein [Streptomyces sp. N35]|uniref:hypothetical protein n=1 Tax=Streptomyces sp. N35 TaxID=2795730 RepID=UPI0018F4A237|nr:hypothetical protein [Streptomyces sp. N35]
MGVCMEVLIVDWTHLRSVPAGQRDRMVEEAAFGPDGAYDYDPPEGWTWPDPDEARWWARYEFVATMTSYKAHFWAGERWEELRPFVDPPLRAALDQFGAPLFWGDHNYTLLPPPEPPFTPAIVSRTADWLPRTATLLWLEPEDVTALRRFWVRAEPDLASLRAPFEQHVVEPIGWIEDFASFSRLVAEWGDVVSRAAERGWGIIGLKC